MMAVVACVTAAIALVFAVCKVAPRTGLALWHFSARWYAGIRLIGAGIIIVLHCEAPLTQSVSDVDMIYGKDERIAMLGNFKFTVILGCKDTETQEYFSKMIGEKRSFLATDPNQKPQPIIRPADLAHLEQDLFVICDDGAIRLRKNFYFK